MERKVEEEMKRQKKDMKQENKHRKIKRFINVCTRVYMYMCV